MFRNIFLLILIGLSASVFAQREIENKKALNFLKTRGEVYIKFDTQAADASKVMQLVSMDHPHTGKWRYAYANIQQFVKLQELNVDYTVETPPSMVRELTMSKKTEEVFDWNSYPTYDQYIELMYGFATKYPSICKVEKIGTSNKGRELLFVKISDNVNDEEPEPDFLYSSTMHGDETAGYILMLRLIDYLLSNYESNSFVAQLINETEIWINPLANPDGTYAYGNNSIAGATRGNALGIDLNRNFPNPQFGDHPYGDDWQTENIAMMDFMSSHNFVLSANFHGGSEVINYPWDTWSTHHPDDEWYRTLSRAYADTVHRYAEPGYLTELDNGITNGYEWYFVKGSRQDYTNSFLHGREVTVEISNLKTPNKSQLGPLWEANYRSFLNYIQAAQFGVRGIIRDRDSRLPLKAKVEIVGHDRDNSYIYSESGNGNYHRLLAPNTYTLEVSKPGYYTKTIAGVQVTQGEANWLDIDLESTQLSAEHAGIQQLTVNPNPVCESTQLSLRLSEPSEVRITIVDFSGKVVFNTDYNLEYGEHTIPIYNTRMTAGLYICNVSSNRQNKQLKLIVIK